MSRIERIGDATLILGDCREVLPTLGQVDACVTDPPYGLRFMGVRWDYDVPSVAAWSAVLAALKPGGHLLAFAGTRTQHRMACAIEDAGFHIRDMIAWVYGNGFPKSLDVGKAIDKAAGAEREATRPGTVERDGFAGTEVRGGTARGWDSGSSGDRPRYDQPATDAARQWNGWGTALKPALEPITVARKPIVGTVAENVQAFGTGALNVDACRVRAGDADDYGRSAANKNGKRPSWVGVYGSGPERDVDYASDLGRFPANLIHDGSDEVLAGFPHTNSAGTQREGRRVCEGKGIFGIPGGDGHRFGDAGSAARFYYCAKASSSERDESNTHPTVKPLALMRYLCMLVSAPGAVVLDPYLGSGSTGVACVELGRKFIGIEVDPKYFEIACERIEAAQRQQRLFA